MPDMPGAISLLPIEPTNCVVNVGIPVAKWMAPTENSLRDLVEDLDQFKEQVDVTSIPDIWAGPKAFEAQLIEDIEEQRIKWRAVLAVIGLRKVMRFNLKVKSVKVPKVGSPEYDKAHSFLKVVSRLMDTEYADYPGGDTINLICSGNETIAMVWPNSIIYPVPGIGANVKWWNSQERKYNDPSEIVTTLSTEDTENQGKQEVQYLYLNEKQRYALAKWLKTLRKRIAGSNLTTANELGSCLISFINDLGYDINDQVLEDDTSSDLMLEDDKDFAINGYGSVLSQVYSTPVSASDLDLSHIRLDGINNNKHVLVIDKAIAEQWKMEASNITCFGATDLASTLQLISNEKTRKQFLEEYRLPSFGTDLWTINEFFTDKIAYITGFSEEGHPFPNSLTEKEENQSAFCFNWRNGSQEFILPIRKEVLEYIEPESLVKNIEIKREGPKSEITVSLKITLSGYENEDTKQTVVLTRIYKDNDIIEWSTVAPSPVPNVQIWPNFRIDFWKQYYVFTGTPVDSNMRIEPIWSGNDVENLNFEVTTHPDSGINVRIRRGSEFPTVFACQLIDKNRPVSVGLICLNEALIVRPVIDIGAVTSYIGVDFGTTNSVVYYANNMGGAAIREQLHFENRNFSVTLIREDNKDDLRRYFFPANRQPETISGTVTNSIRTIFHDFTPIDERQIENFEQPLARGNIYYLENGQNISDDKWVINELKEKIKWEDDATAATNVDRMHSFLYQLCLQAMAEAVMKGAKNIVWQYSWPSSYDSDQSEHYATFWETSLIDAMNDIANISVKDNVFQKTECLSMADYFREGDDDAEEAGLAFANGLLTIDIGGGSTDIAIWKGRNNNGNLKDLNQCSFRMAGTDIFSNYIKTKYRKAPDLLTPLGNGNQVLKKKFERLTRLAEEAGEKPVLWKTFELELESILKYSEKDLIQGMSVAVFSGREFQKLNIVMRDIAFALGGIFYYAGTVIGFLRKTDPNCTINRRLPDCFVGGNGSKLLDWASKGVFDSSRIMKMFFRDCVVYGMLDSMNKSPRELNGFGIDLSINRSKLPKHEVAKGLINSLGSKYNDDDGGGGGLLEFGDDAVFVNSPSDGADNELNGLVEISDMDETSFGFDDVVTNNHKSYPVVSGELYFLKDAAVSSDDKKITAENFTDPSKRISVDFDIKKNRFVRYYKLYNNEVRQRHLFNEKYISFSQRDMSMIFNRVADKLLSRETKTGNGLIIEPIFIMELREAMKVLRSC